MKYYFLSLIISSIIFLIIQYLEYNRISKNNEDDEENIETYSLFNLNNALLFIIIYVVFTIGSYYLSSSFKIPDILTNLISVPKQQEATIEPDARNDIDPKILSRINDNFDIGFEPFEDDSSISSDSTIEEK